MDIMEQEANQLELGDYRQSVPFFMKEIVAEITHQARRSPDVNQRSGVSVRASIANFEALLANAFRRALRLSEAEIVPRMSDVPYLAPSLMGKVEFEAMEDGQETKITQRIINAATKAVFDKHLNVEELDAIPLAFADGLMIETGEAVALSEYVGVLDKVPELAQAVSRMMPDTDGERAAAMEFILEGLHLHKLLNKYAVSGRATFSS